MLLTGKYDNINRNYIVIGADIVKVLKKNPLKVEDLFQKCKKESRLDIDQFLDVITFLWVSGLVLLDEWTLSLIR